MEMIFIINIVLSLFVLVTVTILSILYSQALKRVEKQEHEINEANIKISYYMKELKERCKEKE